MKDYFVKKIVQGSDELLPNTSGEVTIAGGIIAVTKTELDALISSSSLIVGGTYRISGVHPTLYNDGTNSGTTIFLQALTSSVLRSDGVGIFYNPKYDQTADGFGLWSNIGKLTYNTVVGLFQASENITANNGATGKLVGDFYPGFFIITGGDWSAITSITGATSGATANISASTRPSYSIGDNVFWGGYVWTANANQSGTLPVSIDKYTLPSQWSKIPYNETDYNIAYDEISYDIVNDFITRRKEAISNNEVVFTVFDQETFNFDDSAISAFMWGNQLDPEWYLGLNANHVINSYLDCVNFYGSTISGNMLSGYSLVRNNLFYSGTTLDANVFTSFAYLQNNILVQSGVYNNTFHNCIVQFNEMSKGWEFLNRNTIVNSTYIQYNKGAYFTLQNNYFNGFWFYQNTSYKTTNLPFSIQRNRMDSAFIENNVMRTGQMFQNTFQDQSTMRNNTITDGRINQNTFSNMSGISYCTLQGAAEITSNLFIHQTSFNNTLIDNKIMKLVTFERATISSTIGPPLVDTSSATILFSAYSKTVYSRPDLTVKIRYYNNADLMVIANFLD